jgi:hypothetical protein
MGVDHGQSGRQLFRRLMMVDDYNIETQLAGSLNFPRV